MRFLMALHLDEPSEYISIRNADKIIRELILARSTWSLFKESIGTTKAEWRNSKTLIERICNESLYEEIVKRIKCTPEQAKQTISDFIERASNLIDAGDIDADVLAQIALHHDELKLQCEEIVSKKWKETHAVEIAKAEQKLADIEIAVSSSEEKRKELLSEIATAQNKRDQLLAEIEQYEALGRDTLAAIRQKIAEAQKDMAGFIADLSVFSPQSSTTSASSEKGPYWQYVCPPEDLYPIDDIDFAENWHNDFDAIYQNLSRSLNIEPEMSTMLTAFLYAAHINNVPLLIAGPGGCDMAEVL